MVLFRPAFPLDLEPKDSVVIPAGNYAWLKVRLGVGASSPVPPDTNALELQAFVQVRDPDGNILAWGTDLADPDDAGDTYTSASPEYAGLKPVRTFADAATTSLSPAITSATASFRALDVGKAIAGAGIPTGATIASVQSATQVTMSATATVTASPVSVTIGTRIPGLYAEGLPISPTGRFALKILVPAGAEQTYLSSTRHYTVTWRLLRNNVIVTGTEKFDVSPVGAVIFGQDVVTNAEVTNGMATSLPADSVTAIIEEAARTVLADVLDECGIDISTLGALDPSLRIAVIERSRALIYGYDLSTGVSIYKLTEGGDSVTFNGTPDKLAKDLNADAQRRAVRFCKRRSGRYLPGISVAQRPVPRLDENVERAYFTGYWVM